MLRHEQVASLENSVKKAGAFSAFASASNQVTFFIQQSLRLIEVKKFTMSNLFLISVSGPKSPVNPVLPLLYFRRLCLHSAFSACLPDSHQWCILNTSQLQVRPSSISFSVMSGFPQANLSYPRAGHSPSASAGVPKANRP